MKAVSDRLLVDASGELLGPEVLVILLNGTTLASALRAARPELSWTFYTPEHFFLKTLQQFHPECLLEDAAPADESFNALSGDQTAEQSLSVWLQGTTNSGQTVRLCCAPDPPMQQFDSIAFPTNAIGTAELTQELLQAAHQRLRDGGRLLVSSNNPKDKWLHERLRDLFDKITVCNTADGVLYIARKQQALRKIKDFRATFAFRFQERLVAAVSRPGVFSHRRVDGGARALIRSLEFAMQRPGAAAGSGVVRRIVDLGSGSGTVSVAAALAFPEARVLAVDSHARAVQCTAATAVENQVDRVDVLLSSEAVIPDANQWDLVLANPPYYSDYRISELFLMAAKKALRPGGNLHLVTKLTDWHRARMEELFSRVEEVHIGEYDVLMARKS